MDYEKEQAWLQKLHDECMTEEEYDDEEEEGEEDHVSQRSSDSDTEQEFDDDTIQANSYGPYFMGRDKRTKWSKHMPPKNVRTRKENLIVKFPASKPCIRAKKSISEIWECIFDSEMLEMIVSMTNKKIQSISENFSRDRDVRPTDITEIKALLGLLYLAGVRKANHLNTEDLWATDGTGIEAFRLTMNIKRFRFLLRYIRFDDLETRQERVTVDKLAPIRTVMDKFNDNIKKGHSHSSYVTVDEKLESFRGRCGFRQYIPSKPNKYGIKIFALCDAKVFYTSHMEVYVGRQPAGPYQSDSSAKSVVERLCQHIYYSNRNVTTDNWFTSLELSESLRSKGLTLIGTIRKNKRELPLEFNQSSNRPVGSSMFGFGNGTTLVSYVPKRNKNVLLISTMHQGDNLNKDTGKPEIIHTYNETKSGVDVVDKLCAQYNVARCTRRWPMVVFYSILNVAGINAFIVYNSNNSQSSLTRREVLVKLSSSLMYDHQKNRSLCTSLPRSIQLRLQDICGLDKSAQPPPNPGTIGRCKVCDWRKNRKTKYFCKKCAKFLCLEHINVMCSDCYENTL